MSLSGIEYPEMAFKETVYRQETILQPPSFVRTLLLEGKKHIEPQKGLFDEFLAQEVHYCAPGVVNITPDFDLLVYTAVGPYSFDHTYGKLGFALVNKMTGEIHQKTRPVIDIANYNLTPFYPNGIGDPRITLCDDGRVIMIVNGTNQPQNNHKLHAPGFANSGVKIKGAHVLAFELFLPSTLKFQDDSADYTSGINWSFIGEVGPSWHMKNVSMIPGKVCIGDRKIHALIVRDYPGIQLFPLPANLQDISYIPFYDPKQQKRTERLWKKFLKKKAVWTIIDPIFDWEGIGAAKKQIAPGPP